MEQYTFTTSKLQQFTYVEVSFKWNEDHRQTLAEWLKKSAHYMNMFYPDFKETPYSKIMDKRSQIANIHPEINKFKGTMYIRHGQPQDLYDKFIAIYKVPRKTFEMGATAVVTQKFGKIPLPAEVREMNPERNGVEVLVALNTDGEMQTFLIVKSKADGKDFCEPLVKARCDFFKYYEVVKEKYPEFAQEQLDLLETSFLDIIDNKETYNETI